MDFKEMDGKASRMVRDCRMNRWDAFSKAEVVLKVRKMPVGPNCKNTWAIL